MTTIPSRIALPFCLWLAMMGLPTFVAAADRPTILTTYDRYYSARGMA